MPERQPQLSEEDIAGDLAQNAESAAINEVTHSQPVSPETAKTPEEVEGVTLSEIEDSEDFIYVLQNQYGATSAKRNNPVIKTFGMGGVQQLQCMIQKQKLAF
ncbi:MAG: hypothetical protein US94_C0035G0004 [Berkelbacteria bacterium GW2011_GWB1_38_5]|uniref:Uncharacterized protein n=2 Tax=Candidatus Berkelbacteria TaxID=1618330 RepID=A0A0G0PN85_9BACT|nr:MAG: hypothetical protein US94_C0035G0004 [Berkelbacteria bacterium GW2011_GWB1_38_5]KKQ90781.1 MAG: hypothetical protein UT15_C0004G0004 [Berkelbacteria bacterium GW2011_GWA1_39_10]